MEMSSSLLAQCSKLHLSPALKAIVINEGPPRWFSGRGGDVGDRGSIPSRDRSMSVKQVHVLIAPL